MAAKCKPNVLTLEKKVEVLNFLDANCSIRKTAVEFNISNGAVINIKKRKLDLL